MQGVCLVMHDIFNKDMMSLKSKKLFLFDMDGTIYNGNVLFDGTLDLLSSIDRMGGKYVFITNNSSRSVNDYIMKLTSMGIPVTKENFFTSTQATVIYINNNCADKLIYCMGTNSFFEELSSGGINVTTELRDDIGAVVVGFDTELNFEKIKKTCKILKRDIPYIATNPDYACPVEWGFVPDCGAICDMLYHATKRHPVVIGKPSPTMINYVMDKFKTDLQSTVVIGDRLYTDILSGVNAGVDTVCVLTGEATIDAIKEYKDKPTYTVNSVKDIFNAIC